MQVRVAGLEQAIQASQALKRGIQSGVHIALRNWGDQTVIRAKSETPILTGKLRRSVKRVFNTKNSISIVANAENDAGISYAEDQHENQSYRHPRGGKPFFIEDPVMDTQPELVDEIYRVSMFWVK